MHLRLAAVVGLMEEEANPAKIRPWCDVWFQVLLKLPIRLRLLPLRKPTFPC